MSKHVKHHFQFLLLLTWFLFGSVGPSSRHKWQGGYSFVTRCEHAPCAKLCSVHGQWLGCDVDIQQHSVQRPDVCRRVLLQQLLDFLLLWGHKQQYLCRFSFWDEGLLSGEPQCFSCSHDHIILKYNMASQHLEHNLQQATKQGFLHSVCTLWEF